MAQKPTIQKELEISLNGDDKEELYYRIPKKAFQTYTLPIEILQGRIYRLYW